MVSLMDVFDRFSTNGMTLVREIHEAVYVKLMNF